MLTKVIIVFIKVIKTKAKTYGRTWNQFSVFYNGEQNNYYYKYYRNYESTKNHIGLGTNRNE